MIQGPDVVHPGVGSRDTGHRPGLAASGDQTLVVPDDPTVGEADMPTLQIHGNRLAVVQQFDTAAHPGIVREHIEPGLFNSRQDSLRQGRPLVRSVAFTTEHGDAATVAQLAQVHEPCCKKQIDGRGLACADDDNAGRHHLPEGDNT